MSPQRISAPAKTSRTSRRRFLKQTAGLAASAAIIERIGPSGQAGGATDALLPTIKLGPHQVTRLIIGGNPIYGYSHFNRLLSAHQTAWHTPERVVELLKHCEAKGLNTWQNSYHERSISDLGAYRAAGGKMNWLCLGKPDWDQHPEFIEAAAKLKPIGIAPHGALAERLRRQNKLGVLTDLLKRIRNTGVLVGLSSHDPELLELSEEKGWDVDYYMAALYYLTRPRADLEKILGSNIPLGEIYLPGDPPRMFKAIQSARKPCLAYKVLAAGRRVESPAQVRQCFETALANIKPTDALIVGMYQQLGDQVGENAVIVREICSARGEQKKP
jgi:hypothetical protein